MKAFFDDLRRAREAKKLTITDIADATLISAKHLEAIEHGNTSILPQPYVRAFIREYAAAIGLDPQETIRKYDAALARQSPAPLAPERPPIVPSGGMRTRTALFSPRNATIAAGAVLVVTAVILIWNLAAPGESPPTQEIPFQKVVKEHEQRTAPPPPREPLRRPVPADSLTLFASVTDTVWAAIVVDSLPPREYLFRPGNRASWRAHDRFVVTLGNAGGIQFTLNKKPLGALGKRGSVLHNVTITRQHLNSPPP
ncbi:MAG: RodZ domain-containing protein [Bacteroidota bacterium]